MKRDIAAACPELASEVQAPLDATNDVHSPSWRLLFREFVEAIVRIAVRKYEDEEGSLFKAGNPAAMVEYLLYNKVGETKPLEPSSLDRDDYVVFGHVFSRHEAGCKVRSFRLFVCAKKYIRFAISISMMDVAWIDGWMDAVLASNQSINQSINRRIAVN